MTTIAMPPIVGGGFTLPDIQRHVGVTPDGRLGPQTLAAIASKLNMTAPVLQTFALHDPKAFFMGIKETTTLLDQTQVNSINAILDAANTWPVSWVAYALATAWHESRFRPIGELGSKHYLFEMYDIAGKRPAKARELGNHSHGDGIKYAGRGFVQLTGKTNYLNASHLLKVDLVNAPELALDTDYAARILVWGMETGAFTGKRLSDYLPLNAASIHHFKDARRIINGTDKDDEIAEYAADFQTALYEGVYA